MRTFRTSLRARPGSQDRGRVELVTDVFSTDHREHRVTGRLCSVGMVERLLVPFDGEGSGVGPLSWGQRELWGGMVQQRSWFPIGATLPVPEGKSIDDVAADLSFLAGRHQPIRTRLRFGAHRPVQVVAPAGELGLEVVDAGDEDPATVAAGVEQRFRDADYDFAREWPVRAAVVRQHGRLTHQVIIMCHLVTDGFGAVLMFADMTSRDSGTGQAAPVSGMQPLEQARWQGSPAGQRQNRQALQYWERLCRAIPARRFRGADPREPRYWQAMLHSPALHLALPLVTARTGADTSTVLLAAFLVARERVTGINPSVTRVLVSNRFRPGLADVVAPVSQPGLCAVDVAGSFAEVVARVEQRTMAAYKYAYYDTFQLHELIDRVAAERGEQLDVACFFNDRRQPARREPPAGPPTRQELTAALAQTRFRWGRRQDQPTERFFLHVEDVPDTIDISMWADTGYTGPDDIERFLFTMESTVVDAALSSTA